MADDLQGPPSEPTPASDPGAAPPPPAWSDTPASWPPPPAQPQAGAWPGAPAGSQPQQQGYPGAYPPAGAYPPPGYPPQPGYPPPGYGQPMGYPPVGYGAMPQYAGFWIRFVAYLIDAVVFTLAIIVAAISLIILIGFILLPLVALGYFPYFWWKGGSTPGMKVVGLRVVRGIDGGPVSGGSACVRALVFYVESFLSPLGLIGFIWAAFEPRKRALHDMAAGTVVIHTN